MARSHYDVLGVPRTATADEIKKAFRKLARENHPDLHPDDPKATERFKEVNRANEILSDEEKRKMYDELGDAAEQFGYDREKYKQATSHGPFGAGAPFGGFGGAGVNIDDLFSGMFNGGRGVRPPRAGRDRQVRMTIDFTTAAIGAERSIPVGSRSINVRIPAGIRSGGKLRLKGHGEPSPAGGPTGDLIVEIEIAPDPLFSRDNDDLLIEVPITLGEALHGGPIDVPTLGAPVRLRVPPATQNGQKLRAKGKGIVRKGQIPGDLIVTIRVVLPDLKGIDDPAVIAAIDTLEALYGDVRAEVKARIPST